MNIEEHELPQMGALWAAVESLAPGSLLTLDEEDDYIADDLPPDRLAKVETLLEQAPERRDRLRKLRDEFRRGCRVVGEPVPSSKKIVPFPDPRPAWAKEAAVARGVEPVKKWNPAHFLRFPVLGGRAKGEIVEAEDGTWSRLTIQSAEAALCGARLDFDFGGAGKGSLILSETGGICEGHADIFELWEKLDLNRPRVVLAPAPGAGGD